MGAIVDIAHCVAIGAGGKARGAAATRVVSKARVNGNILAGHPVDRKALLELSPYHMPVQLADAVATARDGLVDALDNKPRFSLGNDLRK